MSVFREFSSQPEKDFYLLNEINMWLMGLILMTFFKSGIYWEIEIDGRVFVFLLIAFLCVSAKA